MKLSTVFLRAAIRVQRSSHFTFLAAGGAYAAFDDESHLLEFYAIMSARGDGRDIYIDDDDRAQAKNERVLALCMASTVAASEGK